MVLPFQLKLPAVAGEVEKADCADAWFIASLKVTVICVFTGTLLPVGVLPMIVGGVVSVTVLNCQLYGDCKLLPAKSFAPVPIVTV